MGGCCEGSQGPPRTVELEIIIIIIPRNITNYLEPYYQNLCVFQSPDSITNINMTRQQVAELDINKAGLHWKSLWHPSAIN
jgi:hypothetical protein